MTERIPDNVVDEVKYRLEKFGYPSFDRVIVEKLMAELEETQRERNDAVDSWRSVLKTEAKLREKIAELKSWADSMLRKIEVLEEQIAALTARHEGALVKGAARLAELNDAQAQIAAKDAALRLAWSRLDPMAEADETMATIEAALAAPARETE